MIACGPLHRDRAVQRAVLFGAGIGAVIRTLYNRSLATQRRRREPLRRARGSRQGGGFLRP
ncbi:hypothetical protein WI97_12285 [Burkholderia vietnamiensis]|nr:hypothetical protein WJ02_10650 [Burkholderia vietnamiensis]KVE66480.1 hypothetical protein WI97_12285 [Burkholderia vietnamiensis]KVE97311.1 hypothetical protein WJ01_09195 [Burkholderia vietnamiensis]